MRASSFLQTAALVAGTVVSSFASTSLPSSNDADMLRFFWGVKYADMKLYSEIAGAGFNAIVSCDGCGYYNQNTRTPQKGPAPEMMLYAERMKRDGVDFILRLPYLDAPVLRERYFRMTRDGKKETDLVDAGSEACREELRPAAAASAASAAKLPCAVGMMPAAEMNVNSRPSFTPEAMERFKRATGLEVPDGAVKREAPHWSELSDMPKDRIVDEDYPLLAFYRWFWKEGEGFAAYYDEAVEEFRKVFGPKLFSMYDPCLRVPPLWGTVGHVSHLNEWQVVDPFPFQHSYIVSEQKAKARGCPGQGVVTLVQGIMFRDGAAPMKGPQPASAPAWSVECPNATYITPPPDMVREAVWTVLSRQVDGIGFHGWECLFDSVPYGCSKKSKGYAYTNPETLHVITNLFRDVVMPLGPLFRKMPERAPEVAVFEGYAAAILSGDAPWNWRIAGFYCGRLATAAGLSPYTLYEEEVSRDGVPPSVKVVLMPACGVLTRKACERFLDFRRRGGKIIADKNLVPALTADAQLPTVGPRGEQDGEAYAARYFAVAGELAKTVRKMTQTYVTSSEPRILASARSCGKGADCVFAVNDKRTFGDYVGPWKILPEKGLPNSGTVCVRRRAGAVYDLERHQAVPFVAKDGETSIPVSFETTGGKALLVSDRPLGTLRVLVRAWKDGFAVRILSDDRDVLIPVEIRAVGRKPFACVIENGVFTHAFGKEYETVEVRNLATGEMVRATVSEKPGGVSRITSLEPFSRRRRSDFSREGLEQIRDAGFTGVFVNGGSGYGPDQLSIEVAGISPVLPNLAPQTSRANESELKSRAAMARAAGLDIWWCGWGVAGPDESDWTSRRGPANRLYARRTKAEMKAALIRNGDIFGSRNPRGLNSRGSRPLCLSNPVVMEFYRDAARRIVRDYGIRGMVFLPGDCEPDCCDGTCQRCVASGKSSVERITELMNALYAGGREADPFFEFYATVWNVNPETAAYYREHLSPGIGIAMSVSDNCMSPRPAGRMCFNQPWANFPEAGARCLEEMRRAAAAGRPFMVLGEIGQSEVWDPCHGIPNPTSVLKLLRTASSLPIEASVMDFWGHCAPYVPHANFAVMKAWLADRTTGDETILDRAVDMHYGLSGDNGLIRRARACWEAFERADRASSLCTWSQRFSFAIGRDGARGHLYQALVPPNLRDAQSEWGVRTLRHDVRSLPGYFACGKGDPKRFAEAAESFFDLTRTLAGINADGARTAEREAVNISLAGELYGSQARFIEALDYWEKGDAVALRRVICEEIDAREREIELSSWLGPCGGVNALLVEEDIQNMRLYLALDTFPEAPDGIFDFTVSPYAN